MQFTARVGNGSSFGTVARCEAKALASPRSAWTRAAAYCAQPGNPIAGTGGFVDSALKELSLISAPVTVGRQDSVAHRGAGIGWRSARRGSRAKKAGTSRPGGGGSAGGGGGGRAGRRRRRRPARAVGSASFAGTRRRSG